MSAAYYRYLAWAHPSEGVLHHRIMRLVFVSQTACLLFPLVRGEIFTAVEGIGMGRVCARDVMRNAVHY